MSQPDALLQQQLEAAQREEIAALREAVDLMQAHAPRQRLDEAYRRCEQARATKNVLLRRMGKLPPA